MEEKLSLYNELVGLINERRVNYSKSLEYINKKGVIKINNDNPANYLSSGIYDIKEFSNNNDYNFFQDECYAKFIIVSYIEAILIELDNCFLNMISFSDANFFERITHKSLINDTFELYTADILSLKLFDISFILEYFYMMLQVDGYFDYFLPGMYYKFFALFSLDMKKLGIDITEDELYNNVLALIELRERNLENNKDLINYDDYLDKLKLMKEKYRVDFISLHEDYTFEKVIDDEHKRTNCK